MTIGEHLEELRTRLILGLLGLIVAAVVCFIFGDKVVWYFCRPLAIALEKNQLPPQLYASEASEPFMVYVKISMITAAAFASPWMIYQMWQFVAAGLYPHERKYVTRYLPLSILLLVTGMLFLYFVVLPLMLEFFIRFSIGPAITIGPPGQIDPSAANHPTVVVPMFNGDPAEPVNGQIWMDLVQRRLKFFYDGHVRVLQFGSDQLVTPLITLSQYIDMVVGMLLSFGLAFQMPLVVLALVRMGIVDIPTMKKARRLVYFLMAIVAAVIVPDVVGGMIAPMIPLILLFELGLWLARDSRPLSEHVPWRRRFGRWLRTASTRGLRGDTLRYVAIIALAGVLLYMMTRHNDRPAPPVTPAVNQPASTQPKTQPATGPAAPATVPTGGPRPAQ